MNNTNTANFRDTVRITWAIAAKDILDALKNRTVLVMIFTAFFLIAYDSLMPAVRYGNRPPILALYDAGDSAAVAQLEENEELDLRAMSSQEDLEWYLGGEQVPALGLVLPADFDQRLETAPQVELDGYVDHWVDDATASEMGSFFETLLAEWGGKPIHIEIAADTVFSRAEGAHAWMVAGLMTAVITILGLMTTPTLMIEEKATKTLDALMVSPASSGQLVVGKAIAGLFYCVIVSAAILILNAKLIVHWDAAILAAISGSLFSVSLGLLVGSAVKRQQQMSIVAWLLISPLVLAVPVMDILTTSVAADQLGTLRSIIPLLPTAAVGKVLRLAVSSSAPLSEYGPQVALVAAYVAVTLAVVAGIVKRSDR